MILTHDELDELVQQLMTEGQTLKSLAVSLEFRTPPYHHNWYELDFAAVCPNLETLTLDRIDVNESIFQHPTLKQLSLTNAFVQSNKTVNLSPHLTHVQLEDVNWVNSPTITAMNHPNLKQFDYSLDEDSAETVPHKFIFADCPQLESVYLNVTGDEWTVALGGVLPLLEFRARSGRFGNHKIDIHAVANGSHPDLIKLRDGEGHLAGEVIAFVQNSKYFNVSKAMQIVRLLGGTATDQLDLPDVTLLVAGSDFDESAYDHLEVVSESDFRDEIYEWY